MNVGRIQRRELQLPAAPGGCSTTKVGVPRTAYLRSPAVCSARQHLGDGRREDATEIGVDVGARRLRGARDRRVVDPAAVLLALARVELFDHLPQLVLLARRVVRAEARLGVRADDVDTAVDELDPPGPHVVPDHGRQRVDIPLSAERALRVLEDLERDRRTARPSVAPCCGMPANDVELAAVVAVVGVVAVVLALVVVPDEPPPELDEPTRTTTSTTAPTAAAPRR